MCRAGSKSRTPQAMRASSCSHGPAARSNRRDAKRAATAAALLGQQVLGDLRLGKVVLVRRGDRSEAFRPSGHADLGVPDRSELVDAGRRSGCRTDLLDFLPFLSCVVERRDTVLGSTAVAAAATAAAPATPAGLRRLSAVATFGLLALDEFLDEFLGKLLDSLRFGSGRLRPR